MKKEIAEYIAEFGGLDIYENYSGRGMYGESTTAIECDSMSEFLGVVGDAFFELVEDAKDAGDEYQTDMADDLRESLGNLRYDNLGMGYVFY